MGDEAEQLAEAAKLPWEDRFVHKFWKARVAAYEAVVKEASLCETVDDSACLKAFGAFEIERASPRTRPDARGAVQILAGGMRLQIQDLVRFFRRHPAIVRPG